MRNLKQKLVKKAHAKAAPYLFQPTLVDLVDARAMELGQKALYIYLPNPSVTTGETLSFADLQFKAQALAALILKTHKPGERALLVYDCNLDYIIGFFACLYAGVIAVPVYPPTSPQHLARLMAIIKDSSPSLTLTTKGLRGLCPTEVDCLINEDSVALQGQLFNGPLVNEDDIAFLQYTSGSTGNPKGVVLTHKNLMCNLRMIIDGFKLRQTDVQLSWLPLYHDMGLIGGILNPLANGTTTYLISPMTVVRPLKWLKLLSDLKITGAGAPNFAYDLCCDRISDEDIKTLDLSSLRIMFSGAEVIRQATLDRFASKFAPAKFNPKALTPCYGMAEATLLVTISNPGEGYIEQNKHVSCGRAAKGIELKIINENDQVLAPGMDGEIIIAGNNVTKGYWNKESDEFYVTINGIRFFRTGDLGYVDDHGQLFVTGRKKELLIIRGKKYHPHDIEDAAKKAHSSVNFMVAAAFAVEIANEEKLVFAVEIPTTTKEVVSLEIKKNISAVIQEMFGLNAHEVLLLRQGQIPRTSSGKIRRLACRDNYLKVAWQLYSDDWKNTRLYSKTRKNVKRNSLVVQFHLNNLKRNVSQIIRAN